VDATVLLDYRDGLGVRVLRDQLRIEAVGGGVMGDYGDSGSAVVDPDNRVVGLHVAGNTAGTAAFASPIGKVLDELDVDLITD
jgi:Equine arteritis virus serine endopeptidase S32